ncbi:hypothetical protein Tco_0381297 [Tanacetum coccineum]
MADLTFADSHNMVAYLEKSEDNADFAEIVDFLNASPIRYALTTIVITESSVRRDLHFNDEDGITCLTNTEIFENLQLMGSKSTAWNEFGTNIASAVICLAKKQKFNFSKLIFDAVFNDKYDTLSHTKKVFANIRRQGKDFSGIVTPLFATMLIQSQAVEGEGSGQPTEPQHTPTTTSPSHVEPIPIIASSSQPKKTQKHRKTKRKATKISQASGLTTLVADEIVYDERGDSVERAATTATSLDAEQGSGSPRRQDTMGDRPAQTRFERLSKQSNEPPLLRVNTLGSREDIMKLQELMDLCTKLSDRVLDLENVKDAQALEIKKMKKRVKNLESKKKSRTPQLKRRLFKVRIKSSAEKSLETQGRYGHDTKINTAITSITTASINITTVEPVNTASAPVIIAGVSVSTAEPSTPPSPTTTTPIKDEYLTIAQTLMKIKSEKSKAKGVTMQEPSESGTRVRVPPSQIDPKDKGKTKMVEPEKPKKKKDQIEYDADVAQRLQAELDEEARLKREREEEASKAANIVKWDDVQAMMDADYELAAKL